MDTNRTNVKRVLLVLPFLALILSLVIQNTLLAILISTAMLLAVSWVLYRHLTVLTDTSPDHPKMRTLKFVVLFSAVMLILLRVYAVLTEAGVKNPSENDRAYFTCVFLTVLMLVFGNVCPKLPFNRYVGLRLPWTVTDEETWIMAHRLTGYLTLPSVLFNALSILLLHDPDTRVMFCAVVLLLWVAVPSVLSFCFYRKKFRGK